MLLLQGTFVDDCAVATMAGWRTDFLTQMGFVVPDNINAFGRDHRAFIPRDQMVSALNAADVLVWTTESDEDQGRLDHGSDLQAAEGDRRRTQRVHRQGPRRCHRLRVAAVLPDGGGPTATRVSQGARLTV